MIVNLVQLYEYSHNFISGIFVNNSFVFSTDNGLLAFSLESDLFRQSADYKVIRKILPYPNEKPFDDKNFKEIRHRRPVVCLEHNLTVLPNSNDRHIIYLANNSNIVFLTKNNDGWLEKFSDIPQNWFLVSSKTPHLLKDRPDHKSFKFNNQVFYYCREKEKLLQIKNFVFTHILKYENGLAVYGIICCHLNNVLTFWSTKLEKSLFLAENDFHNSSIRHIKWFQITDELSWLLVFLGNGQVYVYEICNYPHVQNSFSLWLDEDFACVKNILLQNISNNQCLILFTKMAYVVIILYSLTEKKIVSTKREMIPKTAIIPGFTFIKDKQLLILVTDVGKFVCMYLSTTESEVNYTINIVSHNFNDKVKYFTCNSVVFSKNQCMCALTFQCNMPRYSKNDGHVRNKVVLCTIPENLVELESKILLVNNYNYGDVIDCIETLRINKINDKSNELYEVDRSWLDKCPIQNLKLIYWKIVFKSKKNEQDETILQELQMLLHKLPAEYILVKTDAAKFIRSFTQADHTYFCTTCEQMILTFTDYTMFICEFEHKELRCPVTLGPLGIPYLVCSMCFTMANVTAKNQSCVWCFGKYIPNKLLH
ncbi:Hypothetical protein CINCED_3A017806 [Cinara cedri]|uniref:Uncharacterized protein n=1 Tax=Cinara cedri TaxID=506608 RepID=A0A5E4M3D0_9HEMI|nr:Hypothetical protein CINCED_3A017806 [Cinara cedri]